MLNRFLIAMVLVVLASVTRGDDRVMITSNIDDAPSRAWAVYRNAAKENLLVYFAPREQSDRLEPATIGQLQGVRPLGARLPISIASLDDRVYLVFPPVVSERRRMMRVYSLRAVPSPVGGLWVLDPAAQLQVEQPIVSAASLIGMHATSESVWALLKDDEDTLELQRLDPSGWVRVPVTDTIDPRRVELSAIGPDPVLIDRSGLRFVASRFDTRADAWSPIAHELEIGRDTEIHAAPNAMRVIDRAESGGARLRYWSDDGVFLIAEDLEIPEASGIAFLHGNDSIIAVRALDTEQTDEGEPTVDLTELDLNTSQVLYAGAPAVTAPVSAEEFRFLVVMMILVMSGVLIIVILPDRADAMHLPEGTAIADPGRRLVATMIDAFIVTTIVGAFFGVSTAEIVTLTVIMLPGNAWGVFPMTIICGIVYSTLGESLVGATPGKLLMRIRLVAAEPGDPRRPRFWSVLVRNTIKWALPPVAALALIDPEALHRGDRTSRSLVVSPRHDQDPETN
jgi:uncharacterized RDD family membrane protein YckC